MTRSSEKTDRTHVIGAKRIGVPQFQAPATAKRDKQQRGGWLWRGKWKFPAFSLVVFCCYSFQCGFQRGGIGACTAGAAGCWT